jgi:hypothetical protein
MDIPILTKEGFYVMEQSIAKECKDLEPNIGISVALWRLNELVKGYKYALEHGYDTGVTVT